MNYKNSKKIKIAFFISNDGYGHTVRQSSIIKQLLINYKNYNLDIHIFGDAILKKIKFNLPNKINFHKNDNIIQTKKNMDGTLSILKTKKIFGKWKKIKKNLIY